MENEVINSQLGTSPKPRVRSRTNLTSIQIDDNQKQAIDQAFNVFTSENDGEGLNKGDFLEALALAYIKTKGASAQSLERELEESAQPPQTGPATTGPQPLAGDQQIVSA